MKYFYKVFKSENKIIGLRIEIAILDLDNDLVFEREFHKGEYRKVKDLLEEIVKRLGYGAP